MSKKKMNKYSLELNGKVSFLEKNGRKLIRTPIDSEVVLKILMYALNDGLDLMEKDLKAKKAKF